MESPKMSTGATGAPAVPQIESISAVTLATHDMARAVRFYDAEWGAHYFPHCHPGGHELSFAKPLVR
jgi:hypothetical protein